VSGELVQYLAREADRLRALADDCADIARADVLRALSKQNHAAAQFVARCQSEPERVEEDGRALDRLTAKGPHEVSP
jgi:hypothetical protein